MEIVRASAYGLAYFLVFSALGALVAGRRRAWLPFVLAVALVGMLVWTFSRPTLVGVGAAMLVALPSVVSAAFLTWRAPAGVHLESRLASSRPHHPPGPTTGKHAASASDAAPPLVPAGLAPRPRRGLT